MIFRSCAVLFVISIVIFAMNVDEADANPALIAVTQLISHLFVKASKNCLEEAAEQCKQHVKSRHAAVQCGKDFLRRNQGRCLVK